MTFLPLDRPAAHNTIPGRFRDRLRAAARSLLPRPKPIDGEKAQRQNALRAQARADVDRLLR